MIARRKTSATGGRAGWTCPTCRRRFARERQSHSCQRKTVDFHFAGKAPALRAAFDLLTQRLSKTGPPRVDAVQSSIHLISGRAFGGVTVTRGSLRLGFLSERPIDGARIVRRQVLGATRVEHVVVITSPAQIDRELIGWLAASQRLRS